MSNEKISLSFTDGSSDKVYQAELKEVDGGFNVTFQYGRRGKPLQSGTKTTPPVLHVVRTPINTPVFVLN